MSVAIETEARRPQRHAGARRRFASFATPLLLAVLAATAVVALTVGAAGIPLSRLPAALGLAGNSAADANLVGLGMELDAIAAVAVGGTLLTGGRATVIGTLVGALIIQLVRYTLLANGVPDAAALVAKAVIIVLAVWLQRQSHR